MKLRITLEGKTYDVDVEIVEEPQKNVPAPVPRPIKPPPPKPVPSFSLGRRFQADAKTCRSPLAGVIVSVAVSVGHTVAKNDALLVIEAMKMETKIVSQAAGVVKAVRVGAGEAVKPGQVLVEIE